MCIYAVLAEGLGQQFDEGELNSAFLVAMEDFLRLLFQLECFDRAKKYATKGLLIEHAYPMFHAAKYVAEVRLHQRNSSWDTLSYARSVLSYDEHKNMAEYILEYLPDWDMESEPFDDDSEE